MMKAPAVKNEQFLYFLKYCGNVMLHQLPRQQSKSAKIRFLYIVDNQSNCSANLVRQYWLVAN